MDWRWQPVSKDSKKATKVILHPTAAIYEVRRGIDPGSDDSIDLSEFVTQANHTVFEANVSLSFNRELFGNTQPQPNQILEIQFWQRNEWKPCWIGIIESISSFTLQRGTRSMQLVAKTRDQQDIWRNTKRITPLFPQMTDLSHIIMRVARSAGMVGDEILLPPSALMTSHTNTQLADMSAWDMIQAVCIPLGWTPFIDSLGRLRAADRNLQGRKPDVFLEDARLVKVGGQRQRPPKSRVRVQWLNPTLKKYKKQDQLLGSPETVTLGWFIPYWKRTVWFSSDHTQRAENTRINWKDSVSVNTFTELIHAPKIAIEKWTQQDENKGKLSFHNPAAYASIAYLLYTTLIASKRTRVDAVVQVAPIGSIAGVVTVPPGALETLPSPTGSIAESIASGLFLLMMMSVGTGTYHIWGTPYDWVYARNTSEAFDESVPLWVDNTVDIETDFIIHEEHAKAVAIRELIYQAREANKWSVTIVDDPRIEYGDILQFVDGSQLFVEDFSRPLERGSEAILDVKGFMIPVTHPKAGRTIGGVVPIESPPSGGGGEEGGGEEGEPTIPDYGGIVASTLALYNPRVSVGEEDAGKAQLTRAAAWAIYQTDTNIRLLEKDYGAQIANMSTDIVVQQPDGSFADVASTHDNGDGTWNVVATWQPHVGDVNTTDADRWIVPTQALADMAGPMEKL